MLKLRRQLPVYSPIRFRSLLAGASGALGLGRPRERLRGRLEEYYGTADLLLTDSGTTALRLAIRGAMELASRPDADGGGPDAAARNAVALPAYCCYDVVTAAVGAGARVRLYDVDPGTLGPDRPSLEGVLDAGDVAAVVAVHLYGIPVDIARVAGLARARGALVIDDAAQGFGGSIEGRPLGALGSLGVLSFGRGKGITGGGGGALLANDAPGRAALAAVRDLPGRVGVAKLAAQWLLGRPSLYGLPASLPWLGLGETRYREPWPPRGIARGPSAAVLANWEASLNEAEVRRANAGELTGLPGRLGAADVAGARSCPLRLPIAIDVGRRASSSPALERRGIVAGYPRSLASVLDAIGAEPDRSVPQAERLAAGLLTAPAHSLSRPVDVRRALAETRGC
jgi:hypothetical protein